jgi:hypothetical protein
MRQPKRKAAGKSASASVTWSIYTSLEGTGGKPYKAETLDVTPGGALILSSTINGALQVTHVFSPGAYAYAVTDATLDRQVAARKRALAKHIM